MAEPSELMQQQIDKLEKLKKDFEVLLNISKQKFGKMVESHKNEHVEIGLFEKNVLYIKCATPEIAKEIIDQLK